MENIPNESAPSQPVTTQEETRIKQREAVRQQLAIALMAVGGTLIVAAGIYWFFFRGNQ